MNIIYIYQSEIMHDMDAFMREFSKQQEKRDESVETDDTNEFRPQNIRRYKQALSKIYRFLGPYLKNQEMINASNDGKTPDEEIELDLSFPITWTGRIEELSERIHNYIVHFMRYDFIKNGKYTSFANSFYDDVVLDELEIKDIISRREYGAIKPTPRLF